MLYLFVCLFIFTEEEGALEGNSVQESQSAARQFSAWHCTRAFTLQLEEMRTKIPPWLCHNFCAPSERFLVRAGSSLRKHSPGSRWSCYSGSTLWKHMHSPRAGLQRGLCSLPSSLSHCFLSPPAPPHPQVSCPHSPLFPSPLRSLSSTLAGFL